MTSDPFIRPNKQRSLTELSFLILDNGRLFVEKTTIVGMRWEQYSTGDYREWMLRVFFGDGSLSGCVYGDEAQKILASFGLPSKPPKMSW